jgi:DeoR family transcriptional regulator, glycerol-3-phosphate regulon repressor
LLDYDAVEVNVSRAIIEYAHRALLVSDRTKLERAAPVRIGHISQIRTFVTDRLDSAALRQVCKVRGVNIIETDAGAPADQ